MFWLDANNLIEFILILLIGSIDFEFSLRAFQRIPIY